MHRWFVITIVLTVPAHAQHWHEPKPFEPNVPRRFIGIDAPGLRLVGTPISVQARFRRGGSGYIFECGVTWNRDRILQLSISADLWVGWPSTIQLPDGQLVTAYANTTYVHEDANTRTTCETVRWRLPK